MMRRDDFFASLAANNPAFRNMYAYWLDDSESAPLFLAAEKLFRRYARRSCKALLADKKDRIWFIREFIAGKKARRDEARLAARARHAKRRSHKLNATPGWEAELLDFVTREAADVAKRREAATGIAWHIDHMIPLRADNVCGLHVWNNLQVIPAAMNCAKNNRLIWSERGEWLRDIELCKKRRYTP
jgi:hypothetical protein